LFTQPHVACDPAPSHTLRCFPFSLAVASANGDPASELSKMIDRPVRIARDPGKRRGRGVHLPNAHFAVGLANRESSNCWFTTMLSTVILCDCLTPCTLVSRT